MDKIFVIGIDPGKNGGIVSLTNGKVTTIDPMPSTIESIYELLKSLLYPRMERIKTYVYIEKVHSMPTDGVRSAFSFGHHNGVLDSLLIVLDSKNISNYITPTTWMESYGIKREKEPKESKYDFKKRILEFTKLQGVARGGHHKLAGLITLKTCDAYLIALYGYNQIKKEQNGSNTRN